MLLKIDVVRLCEMFGIDEWCEGIFEDFLNIDFLQIYKCLLPETLQFLNIMPLGLN
jgi:hypothetical protein